MYPIVKTPLDVSSYVRSACTKNARRTFFIASRQFIWVGLGLGGMVAIALVPYEWWKQAAVPIMGVLLLLLVAVLFVGEEVFGARRTFFNGSVQPGELAKLAMIVYVATWLASKGDQVRDVTYGLIPFAVLIGVVAGLIVAQPDVSTSVLIVLTALVLRWARPTGCIPFRRNR